MSSVEDGRETKVNFGAIMVFVNRYRDIFIEIPCKGAVRNYLSPSNGSCEQLALCTTRTWRLLRTLLVESGSHDTRVAGTRIFQNAQSGINLSHTRESVDVKMDVDNNTRTESVDGNVIVIMKICMVVSKVL
jgi:hypothetical protein